MEENVAETRSILVWFTMLSPLIVWIFGLLGSLFFNYLGNVGRIDGTRFSFSNVRGDRKEHGGESAAMKNFLVGLGFLSILLTASGCKKKSAPMQPPLPVNIVTAVEKEVNEWDEFTGRLEAVESVEIRPRVSGYITEIRLQAGAIIKKDDLLDVLDPRPHQPDFDRASAEPARMQAQPHPSQTEVGRARRRSRPGSNSETRRTFRMKAPSISSIVVSIPAQAQCGRAWFYKTGTLLSSHRVSLCACGFSERRLIGALSLPTK